MSVNIYACALCGYEYRPKFGDPENGVEPGTDFEDLSADWVCPLCGASKEDFEPLIERMNALGIKYEYINENNQLFEILI